VNQIALPLDWPVADRDEDFLVSEANQAAFEHFRRWSLWPVMATVLTGPRKSGRSLLGRIIVVRRAGGCSTMPRSMTRRSFSMPGTRRRKSAGRC
jgi:hypothetical protein